MDNLIDFSKFAVGKQCDINLEAAKQYFIDEILPYVGEESLERMIKADFAGDPHAVKIEFMRMFIESELMRPSKTDVNKLRSFFSDLSLTTLNPEVPKK